MLVRSTWELSLYESILATKIYIPGLRSNHIYRSALVERVKTGVQGRLTLVSAPPGYGKTTLLSEFAIQCHLPLVWYTLDEQDNTPQVFFHHLFLALQRVCPAFQQVEFPTWQSRDSFVFLISQLADFEQPLVLILDDFHALHNKTLLEDFAFFLEKLPEQLHLILASRCDPPFRLGMFRAHGQLTELRTLDLAFNDRELIDFFQRTTGVNLNIPQAAQLTHLTDGWPAGLQMASISLQKHCDVSQLLESLQGNHRFILDFLLEEVLNRQPQPIQDFLITTSILNRMNSELCEALLSEPLQNGDNLTSQVILEKLEQNNMFVIPLDDQRIWYRYHHLFADLLRIRLEQQTWEKVKNLHDRAANWFEKHNMIWEAVHHILASGNLERLERVMAQNAMAMIYNGQLTQLAEWVRSIPDEIIDQRPWLLLAKAWLLVSTGETARVEALLHNEAAWVIDDFAIENHENFHLQVAILRFYLSVLKDDLTNIQKHLERCQTLLKDSDLLWRAFVLNVFTESLRINGHILYAEQIAHKALQTSRQTNDLSLIIDSYLNLAHVYLDRGKLHNAADTCLKAINLARDKNNVPHSAELVNLGNIYAIYSQVLWEWNELSQGLLYAQEGMHLANQWGQADSLDFTQYMLAKLLQASGDSTGATEAIQSAYLAAEKISPRYSARKARQIAMFYFAQNDLKTAQRWVDSLPAEIFDQLNTANLRDYVGITKIWLALQQNQRALEFLLKWLPLAQQKGSEIRILEGEILLSVAYWQSGDRDQALRIFEEVLKHAKVEGFIRTFVIMGRLSVIELLQACYQRGIQVDYVSKILEACKALPGEIVISKGRTHLPESADSLSERELDVLRYLQTNLTLMDIAVELHVSVHTIRSHAKNIYAKLNVNRRGAAVELAKSLALLK